MPYHPIDTGQPGRPLTKRSCRQQPAVAETAHGVDHGDLEVARQRRVLQAIVTQHQSRPGSHEQRRAARTIGARDDGDAGDLGQHHGFVTHLERIIARDDTRRILATCAVTAQQHTDRDPARRQRRGERSDQRAFTGPAGGNVADHHDGHGGSMCAHQP